jgi:hypothetical protein
MFFVLLFTCFIVGKSIEVKSAIKPFFSLVAITGGTDTRYDILNIFCQHLGRIGIEVKPYYYVNWGQFLDEIIL